MLTSSPWDRLVFHRLLPLAEAVARDVGLLVEHVVLGAGQRAFFARVALVRRLVRLGGWPEASAWALFDPSAPGLVPEAALRPRPILLRQLQVVTAPLAVPAPAPRLSAMALSTEEAARESAWECSERAA